MSAQRNLRCHRFSQCEADEEFLKMRSVSRARAENIDFNLFFDIIARKDCLEYNGYCARVNREHGQSSSKNTNRLHAIT